MASSYMLQLHLGAVETVILSLFSFLLGTFMHKHINILHRWAIPVPAIGGLTVAIIVFLLQISGLILITLDKAVLVPAMVAFFATMGLVAPVQICTSSLKAIPRYWGISTLLVIMQISIGLGLASLFGLDKHYAILLGSLSSNKVGIDTILINGLFKAIEEKDKLKADYFVFQIEKRELPESQAYLKIIYMIAKGYYDTIFNVKNKGLEKIQRGITILQDLEYVDGARYYENYFANQLSNKDL